LDGKNEVRCPFLVLGRGRRHFEGMTPQRFARWGRCEVALSSFAVGLFAGFRFHDGRRHIVGW
jgi:hypothetical protein